MKKCSSKPVAELFGLPPAPKTGRERLVYAAVELVYLHGFQAVGVDQVIAEAGVSKTTFYNHFESRDELFVAAIRLRDEWEMKSFDAALRQVAPDDPQAKLLAIFDVLDLWFTSPDFRGCQFINAAAEFPNPHDPVHAVAAEHKRRTRDGFRDLAAAAGIVAAEAFADQYTALVEGTLILRQIHGRDDAARVVRPAVELLLAHHLPPVGNALRGVP
ncbi:MAG: TetR/AcrR family transcriptional regulator [Planctomycetaceae bacterium]|nr:TetR/AcrR family transcriptional regulator [Planctomycetaceae bacterium]